MPKPKFTIDIEEGTPEILDYTSPRIVDEEGDQIEMKFSGLEQLQAAEV